LSQDSAKEQIQWANPGALGLAAFGLNTLLLQIHNLGWMANTMPIVFGLFWGGVAQFVAGLIEGKRGDSFGLTAFCSFAVFWIGLSMASLLEWTGVIVIDKSGLGWTFIVWTIFNLILTLATLKMTRVHFLLFSSVNVLLLLLAAHNFWGLPLVVPGIAGLIPGFLATYAAAAVILNTRYGRTVCPMGEFK
jgi:succinate-acetate transporter protein